MADSFSETTRQGFLSRIGGALMGLLIGPLLIIGAIILLGWNEGRAVAAINGLNEAGGEVVEVHDGHVVPANDGKLVHLSGAISAQTPVRDDALGMDFAGQVLVQRDASMFQWVEHKKTRTKHHAGGSKTTTTTYTYSTEWSGSANDSGQFKHPDGHANPAMPFSSGRLLAGGPKLDDFSLDATALHGIEPDKALSPTAPAGWQREGSSLFNGDPASPKVGDMRVSYHGLPAGTTISILAAQSGQGFAPFITSNGYSVELAETGQRPANVLLSDKRSSESTLTWILRGVGALVIFFGFLIFFRPLATLASVLPFLGRLVGGATALISLVLTVPLTLVVIALAWLAVRPWLGAALLVAAAVALYFLGRWHRARKRASAGATSQASQSPPPPPSASPPPPPGPPPAPPPLPSNA